MRPIHYILEDGVPIACDDIQKWGDYMETEDRIVRKTQLVLNGMNILVSTIFLGVDHQFAQDENLPPLLFETMIFTGSRNHNLEHMMWRAPSINGAQSNHEKAIAEIQRYEKSGKFTILSDTLHRPD